MKQRILAILAMTIFLICFSACINNVDKDEPLQNKQEEVVNPFEEGDQDTIILGTLGHKPASINTNINQEGSFVYTGGEFTLHYEVIAEGSAKNVGFLIYVDGVAQPYKTSDSVKYEYLKNFTLAEDNVAQGIEFVFEPITGKAGETVTMNIVSIYNAQFQPDMINTTGFGMYHDALASNQTLYFEQDSSPTFSVYDIAQDDAVLTYESEKLPITSQYLKEEFSDGAGVEITQELLDTTPKSYFTINGKVEYDYITFDNNEELLIEYYLAGPQNMQHQTTFYLNHIPISKDHVISTSTTLEKGYVEKISIKLDADSLDELTTFYAVSVPTNSDNENGIYAGLTKTHSIILTNKETTNIEEEQLTENRNEDGIPEDNLANGFSAISYDDIGAEISNMFYAGEYMAVVADKIYLYDVNNEFVIAKADYQIEMPDQVESSDKEKVIFHDGYVQSAGYTVVSFKQIDNGYAAFLSTGGFTISDCLIYDENLSLIDAIDLNDITNSRAISADITSDGSKIVFYTPDTGLSALDVFAKTAQIEIDIETLQNSEGILGISDIMFFDNESFIFNANTVSLPIVAGSDAITNIATYNLNTKTLINNEIKSHNFLQDNQVGVSRTVLTPDSRFDYSSLGVFDNNNNSVSSFLLEGKNEANYGVFLSSEQKHIMTLTKENEKWKICIYEFESNKKIAEKYIDFLDEEFYGNAGKILFFDESNICALIVGVYGNEGGAQIICFSI